MTLSEELTWRGFVGQHTFADISEIDKGDKTFYLGVDPSADSMTIGNLAVLILCLHFAKAGHHAILLAGGATGLAGGDPDGKDETRARLGEETIEHNIASIQKQFQQIFRDQDFDLVNNYDWFRNINYVDFLHNVGWLFSMTQLLDREFIKSRIGEGGKGINYAEFSYALIQGYDFLHLFREKNATIQLCAVDQFGNCAAGMSMIRKLDNARADVFAMPLIMNRSTGKKFGKSEGGAVWLAPDKTSPFQFYQFWLNVDDAGVIDYLKIYTFLEREQIEATAENHFANPGQRLAQRTLAREVTTLVHGRQVTENVEHVSRILFGENDFREISDDELKILSREIPTVKLRQDLSVVDALTEASVSSSRGDATRLIKQNAVSLNGDKIQEDTIIADKSLIKKGKNQFVLVK